MLLSAKSGNSDELIAGAGLGVPIADPADPTDALRAALGWSDSERAVYATRARQAAESAFAAPAIARRLIRE